VSFVGVCLVAFFVALLGSIPMAGPVAVLVLSRAAGKKFDEALRIAIGSAVAEGCYAALAFWGINTFLAKHKAIIPVSHAVTALVLAGLGVRFVFWKAKDEREEKREKGSKKYGPLFEGFAFTAINPTLLLTWSGATTVLYARGILKPHAPSWLTAPYGVCACLGVVAWWVLVTFLMRKYEDKFKRSLLTWVVRGVGIFLIFLGVWSGVELVLLLTGKKKAEVARIESVEMRIRSREIWTRTTSCGRGPYDRGALNRWAGAALIRK